MDVETAILYIMWFILPLYSSYIMKWQFKKEIPEGTKERGEKILTDLEILIQKAKEFFGVNKK